MAKPTNVPPEVAERVAKVRAAVAAGQVASIRPELATEFYWSFGDEPSADEAVRQLEKSAELRAELVKVLDAGCAKERDAKTIVCPPEGMSEAATGYRATFEEKDGWKMTAFVAGD